MWLNFQNHATRYSLEPAILQRLRNLEPLTPAVRPVIGIQLAPAFVGCSTYLALNGGEIDLLVKLLIGYGVLQLLFLIRLLPWIFQNGFTVSFWAFSFGLASKVRQICCLACSVYPYSGLPPS